MTLVIILLMNLANKMTTSKKPILLEGVAASPGIAFGEARVVYSWEQSVEERDIEASQVEEEIKRLDRAVAGCMDELRQLKESAGRKAGGPVAMIFESQLMVASDQEFLKNVKERIRETQKSAEYIYSMMVEESLAPLKSSKDPYLRQMVVDIEAVSNRIIRRLTGQVVRHIDRTEDYIYVGESFTAAEVMSLFERKVRAIITSKGGKNSHMALIARSLLIPTVLAVPQIHLKIKTGDRIIVDGDKGTITIHPSQKEWNELRKKKARTSILQHLKLDRLPQFPPKTSDGKPIYLGANFDIPGPADQVLAERNIGIGLYRTEFLYLQNGIFPTEEKQFEIYDKIADKYYPNDVIIRTFDLGSDKYLNNDYMEKENNPALGWRGIRAAFDMPNVFSNQVTAILKASHRSNVKILLPMISDINELKRAMRIIRRTMTSLKKKNIPYDDKIEIGIMVEVPSAAVAADVFVDRVDFFSIGSNDLTQYTLAADRDNKKLAKIFNPAHPAVLRMIKLTLDAAKSKNKPVNMCGEMAGDILSIPLLIGMGISLLSMNPSKLYNASKLIPKIDYSDTLELAQKALKLKTLKEIEALLLDYNMSL